MEGERVGRGMGEGCRGEGRVGDAGVRCSAKNLAPEHQHRTPEGMVGGVEDEKFVQSSTENRLRILKKR